MALTKVPASLLDKSAHVDFADNERIRLGTSQDLEIFHDGTHSFIQDSGTGDLIIYGTGEDLAKFKDDGAVELYYDGSKKIETTSAGGTVTGTLTVTGDLDITGNVNSASVTDLDVTDKTITVGVGQTEANSGDSGLIVDGSAASLLWDESNDRFNFNKRLKVAEDLMIDASGTASTTIELGAGTADNHYAYIDLIGDSTYSDYGLRLIRNNTGANTSSFIYHRGTGALVIAAQDNGGHIKMSTAGTERLRLTNTGLGIGMTPAEVLDLTAASGDTRLRLNAASGADTEIKFFNDSTAQYTIGHDDATDNFVIGGANVDAPMVSIDKSGRMMIGTTTEGRAGEGADMLTIGDISAHSGLTMRSGTSGYGSIYFSDATSGTAEYAGYIQYSHANDILHMAVGSSIAMNIKSGMVGIGGNITPARPLHIVGPDGVSGLTEGNSRTALFLDNAGATYINIASANDSAGAIFFSDAAANNRGKVRYHHNNDYMDFDTAGTHRLRIDENGNVSISNDGAVPHTLSKLHIKGSAFTMSDANGNASGGIQIFNISKSAANSATAVFKVARDHGAHAGLAIVTKSNSGDSAAKVFAWSACYNGTPDIQSLSSNIGGYTDFTASGTVSNDEFTFKLTNGDSNSRSFRVTVIYGGAATLGTPTLY